MEAVNVVQDDVRPDESHSKIHSWIAGTCNEPQGLHHDNELKELSNLRVPTNRFTQESTTAGPAYPLALDRTPKDNPREATGKAFGDMKPPVRVPENSDHSSLRSSIQPAVSSTLSTATPISNVDSSAKTVSSAPTSIPSCSSGLSDIREVEKGVFAAPTMTMKLQDRLAWDKIQPKLQDTIFNTFRPQKNMDDTISCEFMMGGPSPTELKPTIFLVCCHKLCRKQLRKILKKQKWMTAYEYQFVVLVDAVENLSPDYLENIHGTSQILVEVFVPSGKTSWSGLKAQAQSLVHQEPINFTIGGILLIDGEAFGLTTKHGIETLMAVDDASSDPDNDDDYDSAAEDSYSPFITFQDAGSIRTQGHAETERPDPVSGSRTTGPHHKACLVDNTAPGRTPQCGSEWRHLGQSHAPNVVGSTISCGRLDWSLVKFDPRYGVSHSSLVNTLVTPINGHLETTSFLNRSAMTGGEVWINAGLTGPVKGWLVDSPALFHRHGKYFEVFQVIPDQPLGAWISTELDSHSHCADFFSS